MTHAIPFFCVTRRAKLRRRVRLTQPKPSHTRRGAISFCTRRELPRPGFRHAPHCLMFHPLLRVLASFYYVLFGKQSKAKHPP